jgi:cyclic pyranopterin phosphate synthase
MRQTLPFLRLLDSFGRNHTYLRISITERCNLRCQYCMPADGVELTPAPQLLTPEETLRLARLFVSLGVSKIRVTGGEPLVHPHVEDLCRGLSTIPGVRQLGITTNGLRLSSKLMVLRDVGVTSLNISLDTLHPTRFAIIARRNGLDRVRQGIREALECGLDTKLNCVVMRDVNDDELGDFVALSKDDPLSVRFIEFMPFDANQWSSKAVVGYTDMLAAIRKLYPTIERVGESPHDTAKLWRVPGFRGTVGFISSMTDHFCAGCNRLRLMADGDLKVCLFGGSEVNLKQLMGSGATDSDLEAAIRNALQRKHLQHAGHSGLQDLAKAPNRPMIRIGG